MKLDERIQIIERKRNEEAVRQDRIDKAVENYSFRPVVESDPDRLIKETASFEIRKMTKVDLADNVVMFKNDGFTVDKLMKDVRFRVNAAL